MMEFAANWIVRDELYPHLAAGIFPACVSSLEWTSSRSFRGQVQDLTEQARLCPRELIQERCTQYDYTIVLFLMNFSQTALEPISAEVATRDLR